MVYVTTRGPRDSGIAVSVPSPTPISCCATEDVAYNKDSMITVQCKSPLQNVSRHRAAHDEVGTE